MKDGKEMETTTNKATEKVKKLNVLRSAIDNLHPRLNERTGKGNGRFSYKYSK